MVCDNFPICEYNVDAILYYMLVMPNYMKKYFTRMCQ